MGSDSISPPLPPSHLCFIDLKTRFKAKSDKLRMKPTTPTTSSFRRKPGTFVFPWPSRRFSTHIIGRRTAGGSRAPSSRWGSIQTQITNGRAGRLPRRSATLNRRSCPNSSDVTVPWIFASMDMFIVLDIHHALCNPAGESSEPPYPALTSLDQCPRWIYDTPHPTSLLQRVGMAA